MSERCRGLIGFIFGHKFKPRYTTARLDSAMHHPPPSMEQIERLLDSITFDSDKRGALNTVEEMHRNGNDTEEDQYIGDVCIRCGKVVRA